MIRFAARGWLLAVLLLSACAGAESTPAHTPTATSRPEPTPLPTLEAWTAPAEPITLNSAARLREIGRLDAPEPPTTIFAHALSLDSALLAGLNNDYLVVWDLVDGDLLFSVDRRGANAVMFGPDRQHVYTLGLSGEIYVYDALRGDVIESLGAFDLYNGIWAYDPVGGWLALGSDGGAVQVWDMLERDSLPVLEGPEVPVATMSFSPDGATLAVADRNGTIGLWDFSAGETRAAIDLLTPVRALAFAPDGTALAVNSDDGIVILDSASARVVRGLNDSAVSGVFAFAESAGMLVTGGQDGDLNLWDIVAGQRTAILPETQGDRPSIAVSPGGDMAVTTKRTGATLWNIDGIASGTVLRGNTALPQMDLLRAVWTTDGLQILLFEAVGPIRVLGIP